MYQAMLTKIGDPSCLKTEVGSKQGHALRKKTKQQKFLHDRVCYRIGPQLPAAPKCARGSKNLWVTKF